MADMIARSEKYFSANSVEGDKVFRLTIKDILFDVPVGSGENRKLCDVVSFVEDRRQLILKPCHNADLAIALGSRNSDDWIGCEIELFETEVKLGNRLVKAVRTRKAA